MDFSSIFKTIRKNKLRSSAFIIELSLGSLIIILALASYQYCVWTLDKSKQVITPNVYNVNIVQKNDDLMGRELTFGEPQSFDLFKQKVQFLYSLLENNTDIAMIGEVKNFSFGFFPEHREQANMIKCSNNKVTVYSMNKEMTQMYNFKVKEGMSFSQYFGSGESDENIIPILITEALWKDNNSIGSTIKLPGIGGNYKIIGVLDKNYPTLENLYGSFGDTSSNDTGLNAKYACVTCRPIDSDYDILYVKLKDGADMEVVKKELDAKVNKSDTVQFISLNEMAEGILSGSSYTIRYVYYGIVILILSSFGIISTVMNSISRRRREFGVRIAVGATKTYIEKLIVGEIAVLFVLSQIITLLFTYFLGRSLKGLVLSWNVVAPSLGMMLILTIISIIPAFIRAAKMKPIDLIHERR